ncbi:MAG: hypothetical protein QMC67_10340 [Candidatus Wallbacteria bacterium]
MIEIIGQVAQKYQEIIYGLVVYGRQMGITNLTPAMVNMFFLLCFFIIAYKFYSLAKKTVIFLIIMGIILLPFLFLIISNFFLKNKSLEQIVQ